MKRIFLTLTMVSLVFLATAFVLGISIDDPTSRDEATQSRIGWHINAAMGALVFSALVHAIVLTYFMGTGRWMEETTRAYRLPEDFLSESRVIKHRTIPAMVLCLGLIIVTAALGGAADPASPLSNNRWLGLSPALFHFIAAVTTLSVHALVTLWEYMALHRQGELVQAAMAEVRRIRLERGLPV